MLLRNCIPLRMILSIFTIGDDSEREYTTEDETNMIYTITDDTQKLYTTDGDTEIVYDIDARI